MEKNITCPVCGKAGIPDFHSEDVKCPCCGSDLSIYRLIDQIPENSTKTNIWKPISAVAIIAAAGLGILLFMQKPQVALDNSAELAQLKDSIAVLNGQLADNKVALSKVSTFKHVVIKGESFWSISRNFYGTGLRAEELAKYNNKTLDSTLNVGDTLIIK